MFIVDTKNSNQITSHFVTTLLPKLLGKKLVSRHIYVARPVQSSQSSSNYKYKYIRFNYKHKYQVSVSTFNSSLFTLTGSQINLNKASNTICHRLRANPANAHLTER